MPTWHLHLIAVSVANVARPAAELNTSNKFIAKQNSSITKLMVVVRRLAVGPTGLRKPARESNPESSDSCVTKRKIGT